MYFKRQYIIREDFMVIFFIQKTCQFLVCLKTALRAWEGPTCVLLKKKKISVQKFSMSFFDSAMAWPG